MIDGATGSRPAGTEGAPPPAAEQTGSAITVSHREPPFAEGAAPWPVPTADRLVFDQVETVVGLVAPGAPPVRLRVTFDGRGVELAGSPGAPDLVPWSAVRGVWLGLPLSSPSGGAVTPVDLVWVGGSARLLLPGDRSRSVAVSTLEAWLVTWWPQPPGTHPGMTPLPGQAPVRSGWAPQAMTTPPWGPPPVWTLTPPGARSAPSARRRRRASLVVGLALILAGVGLAVGLSRHTTGTQAGPHPATTVPLSPDQQLADRIMLTQSDLPVGWRVDHSGGSSADSPQLRAGEAAITRRFASCMGLTAARAAVVLGGRAANQTAQSASPLFVAPASTAHPGLAVELQTAAAVVHTHRDEQRDLALFSDPRYPGCAATATAAELQLGVDAASGSHGQPGPATPTVESFPAVAGERLVALSVACTITDRSAAVRVQVTSVVVGSDRVEADLQAFAIGGAVPEDVLHSSVAAFEQRVADGGKGVQI